MMDPIQVGGFVFFGLLCCGMLYVAHLIKLDTLRSEEKWARKREKKKAKKNKKKIAAASVANQLL